MVVIVPTNVEVKDTAILWMTGGKNEAEFHPEENNENIQVAVDFATYSRMVSAVLFHIPNQPIVYAEDPLQSARSEDSSIAFTWWHYMNDPTHDSEYLLRLPMTKAGVKALDTITEFLTSESAPPEIQSLELHPTQFIVSGASKRGWTTWTVGAVDPRVMAIVPVVMDELNFIENIKHHYRSYGGWSFELYDYWSLNLTLYFENPKMQDMFDIVDVFEYRDKLIIPKFVCNAADDEFFLPDDTRYWWHDMPMEYEMNKFITWPNFGHSSAIVQMVPAVNTWLREIIKAHDFLKNKYDGERPAVTTIAERNEASVELMSVATIPRFNWTIDNVTGSITVRSETQPKSVNLWYATTCNDKRRDFRMVNNDETCECGFAVDDLCLNLIIWVSEELEETSPGSLTWVGEKAPLEDGRWIAFFVDLEFAPSSLTTSGWPVGEEGILEFSTSVSIVPDTFPFSDCSGAECLGDLV